MCRPRRSRQDAEVLEESSFSPSTRWRFLVITSANLNQILVTIIKYFLIACLSAWTDVQMYIFKSPNQHSWLQWHQHWEWQERARISKTPKWVWSSLPLPSSASYIFFYKDRAGNFLEIFTRPNTNATILASKYYHMINAIHCYRTSTSQLDHVQTNFHQL